MPQMRSFMDAIDEWDAAGIAKGMRHGKASAIVLQLTRKFGPLSETLKERVNGLSESDLDDLLIAVLHFKDLREAENWLAQNASPS